MGRVSAAASWSKNFVYALRRSFLRNASNMVAASKARPITDAAGIGLLSGATCTAVQVPAGIPASRLPAASQGGARVDADGQRALAGNVVQGNQLRDVGLGANVGDRHARIHIARCNQMDF